MATRNQVTQALEVLADGIAAAITALQSPPSPGPDPTPAPVSDEPEFLDGVLASISGMLQNLDTALGRHAPSITPPVPAGKAAEPVIDPITGRVK